MGTTLENGVYLPSEGERNCYAGLKTNWEILDQKVADVTALQQAVAGALHREIVESLPTTDINPNTIYMILSGTSATENVYNEFMYVNNAWELIGTSATDLTNYYTKAEVDGKLLLKANASDLTSHTGDTTIHVTTADKNRWNNQTYVFRYSSTALVASSTNSNALLDNTDNLKVGDKVIDSSGVLFSITAIDTQNSTFTIGTALVDLAQDSDVVHKSGDETISGVKSFINYFLGKDLSGQTVDLNDCVDAYSGAIHYYYAVSNYTNISNKPENKPFILESKTVRYVSSIDYIYYQKFYTADYNAPLSIYTRYYRSGSASWSNWIKDTDKFVTTDTNQTISGQKAFTDINAISNSAEIGVSGGNNSFKVLDKNKKTVLRLEGGTYSSGMAYSYFLVNNGSDAFNGVTLYQTSANSAQLRPYSSTLSVQLGSSSRSFSDCYTSKINTLEPSSLSLPSGNVSDVIDISSYITALDGTSNSYTVPANGWISIAVVGTAIAIVSSSWSDSRYRTGSGNVRMLYPVLKNETLGILVTGTTLAYARFIPCQGNV
ncbi:MAG: hypothetical protein VZR27_09950 [Acutalibacteraceae bacterium]|nr:hypothetical protein [Acutalibacteraceae bacterium]